MKCDAFCDTKGRWVREWKCCGLVWQLPLSSLFPERYDWKPVCHICGGTMLKKKKKIKTTDIDAGGALVNDASDNGTEEALEASYKAKVQKVKKRLKEIGSSGIYLGKFKPGSKVVGRILWPPEQDMFFFEGGLHHGFKIGGKNRAMPCLNAPPKNQDDCPVCEFINALKESVDNLEGDDRKQIDDMLDGRERITVQYKNWFNFALINNEGKSTGVVKVANLSKTHLDEIVTWMEDDDIGNICDVKTGHNIVIEKGDDRGEMSKYKIRLKPTPTSINFPDWRKKCHKLDKVILEFFPRPEMIRHLKANYGELVEELSSDLKWPELERKKKIKKKVKDAEDDV